MPTIARIRGIVVYLPLDDHNPLHFHAQLEEIHRIWESGSSADRQIAVYKETNDMKQVVDHLLEETSADLD